VFTIINIVKIIQVVKSLQKNGNTMKTNFEEEDLLFLYNLLQRGIMATDNILFNQLPHGLEEYQKIMIAFRKKCYEFLEEEDPAQQVVDSILDNINLASISHSY